MKQGYRVGIFDLTSGEPTPRGSLETRKREAEAARQHLGVPVRINVELPNRVLMDGPENRFRAGDRVPPLPPRDRDRRRRAARPPRRRTTTRGT